MSNHTLSPNDPQKHITNGMGEFSVHADQVARKYIFQEHFSRLSENTHRGYISTAKLFARFLSEYGCTVGDLANDAQAWDGLSFGIVEAFKTWLLNRGDALGSIAAHISHIKMYAELSMRSGVISPEEYALISTIRSTKSKDAKRLDKQREISRIGNKKANPVMLTMVDAQKLKQQPVTARGYRDRLIMCLLLDHGLRVSEVVRLQIEEFNLDEKTMIFYRPKVSKTQVHQLTDDTFEAIQSWIDSDYAPLSGLVLRKIRKGGTLGDPGMTTRAVFNVVRKAGEAIDIIGLSPHDCRHYWTTYWAKKEDVNPFKLRQAGGWTSFTTVQRYVRDRRVSNDGFTDIIVNEDDSLT